ncbi:putative reverse transcriptase domain-containing protein [Tanacetum coccineum]
MAVFTISASGGITFCQCIDNAMVDQCLKLGIGDRTSRTRSTETSDGLAAIQAQLNNLGREIKKVNKKVYAAQVGCEQSYSYEASHIDKSIPRKEKDPGSFTLPCCINNVCFDNALADLGASISVMPLSTYLNLGLGELAHTKLTVKLADRTVKYPKRIAENVLVGIGKRNFPVDFIIINMPEDVKVPLVLRRPFLSTTHAKIDVFKRKITFRVGDEKIIFKSVKPASSLIKRVYMLSLREIMELNLEARLMGETLVLNRSLDPLYEDYIELNNLNVPLELRKDQVDDLMPTIEEGEVIDEPMINIIKTRNNESFNEYPSYCDFDWKIHIDCAYNLRSLCMIGFEHVSANFFPILSVNMIYREFYNSIIRDKVELKGKNVVGAFMNVPIFIGNFSVVTHFVVVENMDGYRAQDMGDIILGEPFCKASCVEAKRFDGLLTIYNGSDNVTYQMARSHPRFKHLSNVQCNKIKSLLKEVIVFYNRLDIQNRQILDSKGAIPSTTAADAKVAIQKMAKYSQKWHNGTSRTRSTKTSDGLATIQAQLNNLGREIKNVNEKVYAAQVGCEQFKGPHYTKDCSLKEEGASVSVMPLPTYLNLGLGELAHTKLTVELADKTVKYPKGIAENVLVEPFCKASCVEAKRFDGLIIIHNASDNVTYQMARSHPRFKHLSNAQCNKIKPLLKDLAAKKSTKLAKYRSFGILCVILLNYGMPSNWRGDKGFQPSKNSTWSPREITLYLLFVFNRSKYESKIMDEVDIGDLTIEQYLRLTQENQTPKKIEDMTTPKDMEEEVKYMTDDEVVMSEQEESNHGYTQNIQHFEEKDDVDKWLNVEITKHMINETSSIASNEVDTDDDNTSTTASCLLPKELSPRSFLLPFNIDNHSLYAITTLDAKDNIIPLNVYEYLGLDEFKGTSYNNLKFSPM